MAKALLLLLSLLVPSSLPAFQLPAITSGVLPPVQVPAPPSPWRTGLPETKAAAVSYAAYAVNGAEVIVPHIGCGNALLAVLRAGESQEALAAKLRSAFGSPSSARLAVVQPKARAELELAAANPGSQVVSLNAFLPANVAALFNREPNFGGPNCFNAAFTAAGLMEPGKLRHVGNPEADQLLAMYFKKVPSSSLKPGDVLVLNGGDHGVYYLGGGLIFHKKSFLKQHLYRIALLEKAYYPEPLEWKPGPFEGSSPFNDADEIDKTEAWRPSGMTYGFGAATPEETARVDTILFLTENIERQAPRWDLAKELGYFTERLLENLVSDWGALGKSSNPVLKAYYHRLESLRDQANQSIEVELLSSPHAQSNAYNILKAVWLPRNSYSRDIVGRLLKLYGKDQGALEKTLDAIDTKFEGSPLDQVKAAGN